MHISVLHDAQCSNPTPQNHSHFSPKMVLKLTNNMRLQDQFGDRSCIELQTFAEWILSLGDGILGEDNEGHGIVEIPEDLLINSSTDHVASIVDSIYPDFTSHFGDAAYLDG